jgi:Protein of unknown function (DUF3631)
MTNDFSLDLIRHELTLHFIVSDEQYDAITLWIAGTYFLQHAPDMKLARQFPRLGFVSPEWGSGKSHAVKTVNALCFNSQKPGKRTPAQILNLIDTQKPAKVTIALDELDKVFAHGKDNEQLVSLFNLGYEHDAVIARMSRFKDGANETNAYHPIVYAALSEAKIPGDTLSRCLSIPMVMRDETKDREILEDIDYERLAEVQAMILEWSQRTDVIQQLTEFDIVSIAYPPANRDRQIWRLMLAIAKLESDDWYQRAVAASKYFIESRPKEMGLYRKIMIATYQVIQDEAMMGRKGTHSYHLLERLHDMGIPRWVNENEMAKAFQSYDPKIKPRQVRIDNVNRNGYPHHLFDWAMRHYKIDQEVPKELPEGSTTSTKSTY